MSNDMFAIDWQDPETKKIVMAKYLKPWRWVDTVAVFEEAAKYFKTVDHMAAIVHDQTQFPATQSTVGAIRDMWGRIPPPPKNLQVCIVVDPRKSNSLEVAFEIVERIAFRRTITRFVHTMQEADELLAKNNLK